MIRKYILRGESFCQPTLTSAGPISWPSVAVDNQPHGPMGYLGWESGGGQKGETKGGEN